MPVRVRIYTVRSGDTLRRIALQHYGDGSRWRKIAQYNNIRNADHLRVGQRLRVP